jgi:hypothetical protein
MYGDNAFAPALKIREDELIAILEKITQKYVNNILNILHCC